MNMHLIRNQAIWIASLLLVVLTAVAIWFMVDVHRLQTSAESSHHNLLLAQELSSLRYLLYEYQTSPNKRIEQQLQQAYGNVKSHLNEMEPHHIFDQLQLGSRMQRSEAMMLQLLQNHNYSRKHGEAIIDENLVNLQALTSSISSHSQTSSRDIIDSTRNLTLIFAMVLLLLLVIVLYLIYFLLTRVLRPLQQMRQFSEDMAAEQFNRRISYQRGDEFGQVIAAMEHMRARLHHTIVKLTNTNRDLEAFSYSVSHDLRAPLRSLEGFSVAIMEDYEEKLDETGKDYLNRIRNAANKMSVMINDILQLSRIGRMSMTQEQVEMVAIAKTVMEDLRQKYPQLAIEFHHPKSLVVQGDPRLLQHLLQNLLSNAVKYSSKQPQAEIWLDKVADRSGWYMVQDNGCGFDEKFADKLFVPFQRLHAATDYEGNGIGLSICQRIARMHGGELLAENISPHGARFCFTLSAPQSHQEA